MRDLSGSPGNAPAIGSDGTIYIAAGPLYAFGPDGTNLWSLSAAIFNGPPVIGTDNGIYVAAFGGRSLYAVSPAGQLAWQALGGGSLPPSTAAALDGAGHIYYCVSNSVTALSAQGSVLWTVFGGAPAPGIDGAQTSPVIGPDGTIYGAVGSTLYAIVGTNAPPISPWPMYQQNARHTGKVEKPALKQPQKRTDANFQFQLYPQQLGLTYTIQTSTNLNTWTSLTSFVAITLPMPVVDLTASNTPAKFYRAWSPP